MKRFSRIPLLLAFWAFPGILSSQTLRIFHIDVEQASATLVITPSGKSLLIDAGEDGMGDRIWAIMESAGVPDIDHFVLTHYHKDHYGGIDELVEDHGATLWQTYDRGKKNLLTSSKRGEPNYKNYQKVAGEDAIAITPGYEIPLDSTISVICISSSGAVIGDVNSSPGNDENDNSVALMISYRGFRYFIGGDIEEHTEEKIAEKDLVRDVDVYVANHHGSHTSSSGEFLDDLSPKVVIISNGDHGGHQHPRKITLDNLSGMPDPPAVFQTNKVNHSSRGGHNVPEDFIADPESDDEDGTILITIEATGEYVVSYGSGVEHRFDVRNPVDVVVPGERVVIEELMPNPVGSDDIKESVTLRNRGSVEVSISGWSLVDQSGLSWDIKGDVSILPGASRIITRNSRPMSLNNSGDEIRLVDAMGVIRDFFEYEGSSEGVAISTGH